MCGIAGIAGPAPDRACLLRGMSDALIHRGPDEAGAWVGDGAALAIRRLSIVDVAAGHQPYVNESGTIRAVFNGEIYGHARLRERLTAAGHVLASGADGEVIVHAYEEFGLEFVRHLDGMFAVALWDSRTATLVLARDRLGKKPLFYARHRDGSLSFASELPGLLVDPRVSRRVDPAALAEFLHHGYVPSPHCILSGVAKLSPGTMLIWSPDSVRVHRYWTLDFEPKLRISYADALDELEQRTRDAVVARLMSEVPLGLFLSGGIDSSFVLAQMAAAGVGRIETFAIGFPDGRYDERSHARLVADRLGSVHHEALVEPSDLVELLPTLVRHYGEPFADTSAVPTFYLARWARERITVALTGEGGDELFGGYYRHQAARLGARLDGLPSGARRVVHRAADRLLADPRAHPMSSRQRMHRFLAAAELEPGERYSEWTAALGAAERLALLGQRRPLCAFDPPGTARDPLDRALAVDLARSLPDQLLYKMDIASMASSLEARAPLLDYRLVEWAARLPSSFKQRGRLRKRLLSDALARHLPPDLFTRPKMGFTAPIAGWLRSELYELTTDTLLGSASRERGIVSAGSVERLIARHRAGEDHTKGLWALLMLELWHQQFV